MAANLNYNVNVNTTAGVQALNNLQNKVGALNNSFAGLKSAIGGIAIGAVVGSLLRFADGIQDLSAATGIATSNLLGFQKAVQAFGGSADVADKAILRLVTGIGAANDGSAELQGAFGKVGVSLNDLATLSESDILAKTIRGLEGLTDKSEQAFIKQQLLGKEFRNVATSGLAEAYANSTEESKKYAESIARAAELQDNLEKATSRVKLTLLELLDPIAKFINSLDQERLGSFIENIVKLAAAFVALSALSRATVAIQAIQAAFKGLLATTLGLVFNVLKFGTIFGRVLTAIGAAAIALSAIFPETAAKINVALGNATDAVKEFFGFKPEDNTAVINSNTAATEDASKAADKAAEITRKQKTAIDELKTSISGVTENFARMNEQNISAIRLQTELVGKTKEQIDVRTAEAEIAKRAAEEISKLEAQKSKLNDAQKQQGGAALIDAAIAKIKEQAEVDTEATQQAIKNLEAKRNAYEALKAVQDFAYKSEIDSARKVQDVMDDIRTSTMSGLEKSYEEIAIASRKSADAAVDAENSRRRSAGLAKLTADEEKRYYDEAAKGNAAMARAIEVQYNQSRSFSSGWKKAFNEYADNATNAAKTAENLFKKATQGMEDVIVKFAKTGKFEFKEFVSDMLEQLLRSQIQSTFAGLLGGITGGAGAGGGGGGGQGGGGGGGILDSIAGLFGGGGGGAPGSSANNPMYVIDIGGGGGGFMGPMQQQGGGGFGGIMDTLGSIFGGGPEQLAGPGFEESSGGFFDSLTSGFGDFFSSFSGPEQVGGPQDGGGGFFDSIGSLFDGFFANGGNIGAGKFGVVGESGPELVSGPASVTPMSGGTNVTYNINAVDAMSFKQMLAQDPSFIYGLSMQGAKGVPARR